MFQQSFDPHFGSINLETFISHLCNHASYIFNPRFLSMTFETAYQTYNDAAMPIFQSSFSEYDL